MSRKKSKKAIREENLRHEQELDSIQRKLAETAAGGNVQAMKLFFDRLDKLAKQNPAQNMAYEQMAAIRLAVFGEEIMKCSFHEAKTVGFVSGAESVIVDEAPTENPSVGDAENGEGDE